MMLLALAIIACSLLTAKGLQLQSRTIQSQAICLPSYNWADTTTGQSPCLVAASINAICNDNNWLIPALNASIVYDAPAGPTVSFCTCSWASYNLISACQACQGYSYEIPSWTAYSINCAGNFSNTYFPSNLTIPSNVQIPYWATTNPTTWTNQQFDPTTAQAIAAQNHPDVGTSPASSSSKSVPIGAIVGGVVGGVIVLLAGIFVGLYLIRRTSRTSRTPSNGGSFSMLMANNTHLRPQTDMSTPIDYTTLSSSPMRPPTSPTIRTHVASSILSFPFFSSAGSSVPSPPSVRHQLSVRQPPSVRQQSPPPPSVHRDETAVEPFVLPPSNSPNPDRKQANGAYPVYDPPTAPPSTIMRVDARPTTPTQGGRARFNPPAYTEQTKVSPEAGGGSSSRPPPTSGKIHAKKGSSDTQHSITSSRSGGGGPGTTRSGGGGSISAMGNVVNHITPVRTGITSQLNPHDATIASANASNAIPTGHGRQLSGNTSSSSLNGRHRTTATTDSLSARDIA